MKRSEIPRDSGAVVGCYGVHLYCSHPAHEAGYDSRWSNFYGKEFTGETEAECLAVARKSDGWWISRKDDTGRRAVLCPYHAREVAR